MRKFFDRFTAFDFVIIAMMSALGVVVKPFITTLAHMITGPLLIPAGTVAGGIYMLFLILGAAIVGKKGTATLIGLVEALLVITTGVFGTHGIMSFITYMTPGLGVDILWLLLRHNGCCAICCFLGGIVANLLGCFTVNLVFFRLPFIPLVIMLVTASISGGIGGIVAWNINKVLIRYGVVRKSKKPAQPTKNPQKKQKRIILIALLILTLLLAMFIFLNLDNINKMNEAQQNAFIRIVWQDKEKMLNMQEIMSLPIQELSVIQRSSSFGAGKYNYTAVKMTDLLIYAGLSQEEISKVTVAGADGYVSVINGTELEQNSEVYLAYYQDGKLLGTKAEGGTGPFQLIITNDIFAQRWVRFVSEITVSY